MRIPAPTGLLLCAGLLLLGLTLARTQTPPEGDIAASDYELALPDQTWIADTLSRMSLRQKIAQLIQIRVYGRFLNLQSAEFINIEKDIRENQVGGLVLFAGSIYESALLLNKLQEKSELPLLVASDFERGASFRISDTSPFPWTMAIGAAGSEAFARREGEITAREARALGVHWLFAPVVDVNNNPDNPVINIRSFGEDPELVARMGSAFIQGARSAGALTTAKHFPGHGDTATDSHIGLPVVASDLLRLETVELLPFRSSVEAGVDAIMTAHVAVPRVAEGPDIPATLSARMLTELLRNKMNFRGLVVTDALEMGAITSRYWTGLAAIRAIQAGADVLLLPADATVAINEVERAVKRGEISVDRIDQSVERVLAAKTRVGLHIRRTVPISRMAEVISSPDSLKLVQDIADRSITLVRDSQHLLPVHPLRAPKIFSLVLSSETETSPGSVFQTELRRRFPSVRTAWADARLSDDLLGTIEKNVADADLIICATLIRVITGKGSVSLPDNQRNLVKRLLASGKPVILVAFGNPYVLRIFPQAKSYLCTFSYSDVSQVSAAKAISGEIAVTGKLPVSIPGQSALGEGLEVPRLDTKLRISSTAIPEGSKDEFNEARLKLADYVGTNALAGVSLTVGLRGWLIFSAGAGTIPTSRYSAFLADPPALGLSTLSEVLVTTPAAMLLADEGRLLLGVPVQDYLPEFQAPGKASLRVQDLLYRASELPGSIFDSNLPEYELLQNALSLKPLKPAPDSSAAESAPDLQLLAEIESRAAGRPLGRYLAENLYLPLRSSLYPKSPDADGRIASEPGQPGDPAPPDLTRSLAAYAQMLLNRGLYDHRRYLRPETVDRFTSARSTTEGLQGLGWLKSASADWQGKLFSRASYGSADDGELFFWIDPTRQLFIVLLTNPGTVPGDRRKMDEMRRELCETVLRALPEAERRLN